MCVCVCVCVQHCEWMMFQNKFHLNLTSIDSHKQWTQIVGWVVVIVLHGATSA
jgi:hypothetical protein